MIEYRRRNYQLLNLDQVFYGNQPFLLVQAIDGLFMATQYDIPWREDLFQGYLCPSPRKGGIRKTLINKGFSLLIEYVFQNIYNYVDMLQIRLSCIFEMKKARFLAMS